MLGVEVLLTFPLGGLPSYYDVHMIITGCFCCINGLRQNEAEGSILISLMTLLRTHLLARLRTLLLAHPRALLLTPR